jgi:hypothetical protein
VDFNSWRVVLHSPRSLTTPGTEAAVSKNAGGGGGGCYTSRSFCSRRMENAQIYIIKWTKNMCIGK